MQKYDGQVFRRLAGITGYNDERLSYQVKVEEDGVYPIDGLDILPSQWRWKPRHALAGQPGVASAGPALAFDFTAADLAAFLLTHSAIFLTEVWGSIEEGPLGLQEPDDYGDAADAAIVLKQAYRLLQGAISKVGSPPYQQLNASEDAKQAFDEAWEAALQANKVQEWDISDQEYQARHAAALSQTLEVKQHKVVLEEIAAKCLKDWRNAMVRHLLQCNLDVAEEPLKNVPHQPWTLKKNVRDRDFSYLPILRKAMQALIEQGRKPSAGLVLDYWRTSKTSPIVEVGAQYFTYEVGERQPKTVLRHDLQNAIWRQLVPSPNINQCR